MSEIPSTARTAVNTGRSGSAGPTREVIAVSSQQIINFVAAGLFGILGWLGNNVWTAVQLQQQQITSLNIELAKNYAPRVELQQQFDRINAKLDAIEQQTRHPKTP